MPAFTTKMDKYSKKFLKNTERMANLVDNLRQKLQKSVLGGSEKVRKIILNKENFKHVTGYAC